MHRPRPRSSRAFAKTYIELSVSVTTAGNCSGGTPTIESRNDAMDSYGHTRRIGESLVRNGAWVDMWNG